MYVIVCNGFADWTFGNLEEAKSLLWDLFQEWTHAKPDADNMGFTAHCKRQTTYTFRIVALK